MNDSFSTRTTLDLRGRSVEIWCLEALKGQGRDLARLPYSIRILLENLLRLEDGLSVTREDIEAVLAWDPKAQPSTEIAFTPARVLLQDFTGVPAVVDLAAMRDAMVSLGGDPRKINPGQPVELVIDHSVQVDAYGSPDAARINAEQEFRRNTERYLFLRWGQGAFANFRVIPPSTGIVHQVNLEHLGRVVMEANGQAFPDTLVGTDSHTTMINGLGVLGWGVGGIEAEAAMLGQPVTMLLPQVVGFRLEGTLPEGSTSTDLVLRVTEMLRERGVVGKFVEFFGSGLATVPLADRATLGNMSPEYGATCAIFPVDQVTLDYLRFTGRSEEQVELVEAYMRAQGLFHTAETPEPEYSDSLTLDLATVVPSVAGPRRPQDRVALTDIKEAFLETLETMRPGRGAATSVASVGGKSSVVAVAEPESADRGVPVEYRGARFDLKNGAVVIGAITSCTNTSNPSVMLAAGLLAEKAVKLGLRTKPWVKTSLAPGSKVVTEYLKKSGTLSALETLGFHVVGYGCTTCIGNSGPLPTPVDAAIEEGKLVVAAVLSGNRNFEGRIHQRVRANYLASPPLVVAYSLVGRMDFDPYTEPLGEGTDGQPVFLKDVWPTQHEVAEAVQNAVTSEMFESSYSDVFLGEDEWRALSTPDGDTYAWDKDSTYVRRAPFFDGIEAEPAPLESVQGARVLALLGNSVTTDHISPAGAIKADSPAGRYLTERGALPEDFNSYGSRRGNHEVMMRGTFANIRLRNLLVPGVEGGETVHFPEGQQMAIFDAAMKYASEGVPLIVIAGKEYGSGSSRDWAAKGPALLGVRAVIAESYERIHRSNLVGMGVLPLEFLAGVTATSLGLSGRETYSVEGLTEILAGGFGEERTVKVVASSDNGEVVFDATVRIDTPVEVEYFRHGGILQYVLRRLAVEA